MKFHVHYFDANLVMYVGLYDILLDSTLKIESKISLQLRSVITHRNMLIIVVVVVVVVVVVIVFLLIVVVLVTNYLLPTYIFSVNHAFLCPPREGCTIYLYF